MYPSLHVNRSIIDMKNIFKSYILQNDSKCCLRHEHWKWKSRECDTSKIIHHLIEKFECPIINWNTGISKETFCGLCNNSNCFHDEKPHSSSRCTWTISSSRTYKNFPPLGKRSFWYRFKLCYITSAFVFSLISLCCRYIWGAIYNDSWYHTLLRDVTQRTCAVTPLLFL